MKKEDEVFTLTRQELEAFMGYSRKGTMILPKYEMEWLLKSVDEVLFFIELDKEG